MVEARRVGGWDMWVFQTVAAGALLAEHGATIGRDSRQRDRPTSGITSAQISVDQIKLKIVEGTLVIVNAGQGVVRTAAHHPGGGLVLAAQMKLGEERRGGPG